MAADICHVRGDFSAAWFNRHECSVGRKRFWANECAGRSNECIYSKDGSTSVGQDAGWLDQASYSGNPAPPVLTQCYRTASSFQASTPTLNGKNYSLEYKNALTDPIWIPGFTNLGNGGVEVFTDTNSVGPQRFYRIHQSD